MVQTISSFRMHLCKQFKFITYKILIKYKNIKIKKKLTISNALQFRSNLDELQVKLRTRIANFYNSGHLSP